MKYLCAISLRLFLLIFIFNSLKSYAQLGVNSSVSAQQLVNNIIGQNVSVSNITLNCPSLASGTFTANGTNLGLAGGIILATGNITNAVGPNTYGSITTAFNSIGDPDLDQIVSPDNTKDACVLEFDITPKCDTLAIYFVFGSEEYPEYVGVKNDVFAFFISGPGMPQQNIALIPGTPTPISINNVNNNSNSAYYVDNTMGSTIHYDGFTVPIQAKIIVQPCSTYHMKLAIADVGDDQYDSGVFLAESGLKCINGKVLTMNIDSSAYCDGSNGAVSVDVVGGGPTYSYTWSDGNNIISTTNNTSLTLNAINSLNSGWYYVTVSDPSGCDNLDSIELISDTSSMNLSLTKTDASCVGVNDATTVISVINGNAPYSFSWSGGINNNNNFSGIDSITGLTSGWVNVSVTDSRNCQDSASIQVFDLPGISVTLDSLTNVSCYDSSDAGIYISTSGGNGVYSYKWSNGSNSKDLLNVSVGTYTLSILDITTCADTISYSITEPSPITINGVSKPSSCQIPDGSISVSLSGGTPGYQYSWSNGSNDQNLDSLMAGTYVLTITDSMLCIDTAVLIVSNSGGPSVLIDSVKNLSCNNAKDGFASVNVSGGTPQYNYLWSNGVNVDSLSGVDAGIYFLTVSDQTSCIDIISVSITEPDMIEINTDSISNPLCYNDSNGYISILPIGGTSPYSYLWSGGENTQSLDSLPSGLYEIIVEDNNLCLDSMSFILTQPSALFVSYSFDSVSCFGLCDANADITVSGGGGGYDFSWSHGSEVEDQDSLCGGNYDVTVTDSNGCNKQIGFVIGQPSQVLISSINNSVLCNGDCDVTIDLTVSGGKPSYLYDWSNGDTIEDPDSLCAGSYSVQITDNDSCSNNYSIDVLEPDSISVLLNGVNPNCDLDNGVISAIPSGGTSPYSYVWSGFNNNVASIIGLTDSLYVVTITDQNSCMKVDSIVLIAEPVPVAGFDQNIGCSGDSSIFQDTSSGYVVSWAWDFGVIPQTGSSDQVPSYSYSDTGQFNVSLIVSDSFGCQDTIIKTIAIKPSSPISFDMQPDSGCYPVEINFYQDLAYDTLLTYLWNFGDGDSSFDLSPVHLYDSAGTYDVLFSVINSFGCTSSVFKQGMIIVHDYPIASFEADPVKTPIRNPTIDFIDQSIGAFEWLWSFGDSSVNDNSTIKNPQYTYTSIGMHKVVLYVKNEFGCIDSSINYIEVLPDFGLYVPTAFTPNNDNVNDIFKPIGIPEGIQEYEMSLWDRWGHMFFKTNDFEEGWDGTKEDILVKPGAYVYFIRVKDFMGIDHVFKGTFLKLK